MKSVRIQSYSGSYFPAFGLNRERYSVSFRVQSECGTMRTRITPNSDIFHTVKTCLRPSFLVKLQGCYRPATLLKKLRHRCFPVNFPKALRKPILKKICEQLLLPFCCRYFHKYPKRLFLQRMLLEFFKVTLMQI